MVRFALLNSVKNKNIPAGESLKNRRGTGHAASISEGNSQLCNYCKQVYIIEQAVSRFK